MRSSPASCSLSPCLTYNERTPIAHVCEKVVSGQQSRDQHQLYSEFFELRPRPAIHTSHRVLEPAYQTAHHVNEHRPIRYVHSIENDCTKHSADEIIIDDSVVEDVASPSSARCRCSVEATSAWRPRSAGDGMTSLFGGGGDALVTSSSSASGTPVRAMNQPQITNYSLTSPDVVPDSDMSSMIERLEAK